MVASFFCFFFLLGGGGDVSAGGFLFTGSWGVIFAGDLSGVAEVDSWVVLEDFVFLFFTISVHPSCLPPGSGVNTPFSFSISSFGRPSTFFWGQSLAICPNCLQSQQWGCQPSVIYWPLTEPSIKMCTCVNKRKKKRKQVGVMKEYRQVPATVELVGDEKARVRASLQTEGCGPQRPPVEQPQPRCGRSAMWVLEDNTACYDKEKKLGQYSSLSLSPLISHTPQKHQPFRELSVRDIYFL